MTTAVRPHAPSRGCYQTGCRADGCVRENYLYEKQLDLDHIRGHRRNRDATQTRIHIERLIANGWIHRQIAEASGVGRTAVSDIARGQAEVRTATALAILSIPIGPPPVPALGVDATGTVRRIQALMFIGHACPAIAARANTSADKLNRISAGWFTTIHPDTAAAIARAYRLLVATPGTSWRARAHARCHNWHGPMAWDDIDNPAAQPDIDPHANKRGRPAKVDEARVVRLTDEGLTDEQIAWEMGCHTRTVVRARNRARTEAIFGTAA